MSRATLRSAGLRPTFARLCVLEVLQADPQRWLEGEAVYRELLANGTSISMATVYRAIKDLDCRGVLRREWRAGLSGGKAIYRLSVDDSRGHEDAIECRQCGARVCMDDPVLREGLRQFASRRGLVAASQPMMVQMTCMHCADSLGRRLAVGKRSGSAAVNATVRAASAGAS